MSEASAKAEGTMSTEPQTIAIVLTVEQKLTGKEEEITAQVGAA